MTTDNGFLKDDRAKAIARLSALERLREQAREAKRAVMIETIEKMIQSELRVLALRDGSTEKPSR